MPRPGSTCVAVRTRRRMRRPYEALVCPTRSVVDGVHVVLGIDDGLDHGWPICVERLGYRGFERVGAARAHCRHAEIMCGRLAISFVCSSVPYSGNCRLICLTLMSASQRSSSTTTGSVSPRRLAVATSPQVIWKQPSPRRHTTGRSGRASLAAIAPGSPKPIDDQPFVM